MKTEELDKICCEFAGIEPIDVEVYREHGESDQDYEYRCKDAYGKASARGELEYPPVSTSWEAAGQLMDALILKGVLYEADGEGADGYEFKHSISLWYSANIGVEPRERVDVSAATFPMALALAVAALAKESH